MKQLRAQGLTLKARCPVKNSGRSLFVSATFVFVILAAGGAHAQESGSALYQQLKGLELSGGSAPANNVVLKRDRGEMTFTSGTFYFQAPVAGKVRGAVFIGKGTFRAEPPPSLFEKENLQRMLGADAVESTFETAVLRFSDDTFDVIGKGATAGAASAEAQKLAQEFEPRFLRETGANVSSRLALSILNGESPGFFLAQFDKGRRGRFTYVVDVQCRLPTFNFGINGGEKGMVFAYNPNQFENDIWFAFYSEADYQAGRVNYSDTFDLVEIPHYAMTVDLLEPRQSLRVSAQATAVSLADGVRAIPFALTEGLPEWDQLRRKKGMRITSAKLNGAPVDAIQEEWESGFTVFLPAAMKARDGFQLEMDVEGDFIYDQSDTFDCHYPFINGQWYPRHGYLARSKFDITFRHAKKYKVAGPGARVKEGLEDDNANVILTSYKIEEPVALVTFAMGPYKVYQEVRKLVEGELPTEFFSLAGSRDIPIEVEMSDGRIEVIRVPLTIKEDFVLAEMGNAVDYMGALFGKYPYPIFRAAFHPFGFGQGFATMLAIPNADSARKGTFVFISHETAHQWWGNIVAWRSYRDQWLSEGFAEYSGLLYMRLRTNKQGDLEELLSAKRNSLKAAPRTQTGVGKNRVNDIGPIILGRRLRSSRSMNAYSTLTYNKGAMVLRMLHFLFTDPSTGDGQPFFEMMKDFVERHRNSSATTESFMQVASEHFVRTPIAKKYGVKDLTWFFRQWVYQTHLPAYRMEYQTQQQPDGSVAVQGVVYQDNAPADWFMPLPLVFEFDKNQRATGTVHAYGPKTPFNIKLPMKPKKVELDPQMWVLSEKTSTSGR